jgi:hypothetical protein
MLSAQERSILGIADSDYLFDEDSGLLSCMVPEFGSTMRVVLTCLIRDGSIGWVINGWCIQTSSYCLKAKDRTDMKPVSSSIMAGFCYI